MIKINNVTRYQSFVDTLYFNILIWIVRPINYPSSEKNTAKKSNYSKITSKMTIGETSELRSDLELLKNKVDI